MRSRLSLLTSQFQDGGRDVISREENCCHLVSGYAAPVPDLKYISFKIDVVSLPSIGGPMAQVCGLGPIRVGGRLVLFCIHRLNRVYGALVVTLWTCYGALYLLWYYYYYY